MTGLPEVTAELSGLSHDLCHSVRPSREPPELGICDCITNCEQKHGNKYHRLIHGDQCLHHNKSVQQQ